MGYISTHYGIQPHFTCCYLNVLLIYIMLNSTFLLFRSISLARVMYSSRSCAFRSELFCSSTRAWEMEDSNWSGSEPPAFSILAPADICKHKYINLPFNQTMRGRGGCEYVLANGHLSTFYGWRRTSRNIVTHSYIIFVTRQNLVRSIRPTIMRGTFVCKQSFAYTLHQKYYEDGTSCSFTQVNIFKLVNTEELLINFCPKHIQYVCSSF